MVYKCCVPGCNGNYNEENKVTVFSFPRDENLWQIWLSVIPRKFSPTKNSKVCIRHFREDDIERTAEACDSRTGVKIVAPLDVIRLKKAAVPCKFPTVKYKPASKHLQENCKNTENIAKANVNKKKKENVEKVIRKLKLRNKTSERKRKYVKNVQTKTLIKESVEPQKENNESLANLQQKTVRKADEENGMTFFNLEEIEKSLLKRQIDAWHMLKTNEKLVFAVITARDKPTFLLSATVDKDLQMRLFNRRKEVKQLSGYTYPAKIQKVEDLEMALESLLAKHLKTKIRK